MHAVSAQLTAAHASSVVAKSMGTASKTMGAMNKQIGAHQIAATMQAFQQESMKMDMADSMSNGVLCDGAHPAVSDSIDALFDDDVEAGADEELSKVFDEIGLEVKSQMVSAPTRKPAGMGAAVNLPDLDAELAAAGLH